MTEPTNTLLLLVVSNFLAGVGCGVIWGIVIGLRLAKYWHKPKSHPIPEHMP